MENHAIAEVLELVADLMDLHNEDPFKVRAYRQGVLNAEQATVPLATLQAADLQKALGKSIGLSVADLLAKGSFPKMDELMAATPAGVIQVLQVKGLGPKKVGTLWREAGITSLEELQAAAEAGNIAKLKGFGAKTQDSILANLAAMKANQGKLHWATAEPLVDQLRRELAALTDVQVEVTGAFRRQDEIIDNLEWVVCSATLPATAAVLKALAWFKYDAEASGLLSLRGKHVAEGQEGVMLTFHLGSTGQFAQLLALTTGAAAHLTEKKTGNPSLAEVVAKNRFATEEEFYAKAGLPYIIPEMRNGLNEWQWAESNTPDALIQTSQLKGSLHNHSTYSDGRHTLREMAQACIDRGWQYLGICDHSQTASYANGLDMDRVAKQHHEIDQLNRELAPFRIFKGIESDILPDGNLDYDPGTLATFDFVVASVHSGLNMDRDRATQRILAAIRNPYTTMVGHISTRLLLRRDGFPVDYDAIFAACKEHGVILELNSHYMRLDMDWRLLPQYLETGLMTSLNPDAHETAGLDHMRYGVNIARKAGVLTTQVLNTLDVDQLAAYFAERKKARGIG